MVTLSNNFLAAILVLVSTRKDAVESHVVRGPRGETNNRLNGWPGKFFSDNNNGYTGPFRPFGDRPLDGGTSTVGSLLADAIQEVIGDFKKVARELQVITDASSNAPPYELYETTDSISLHIDLPGCKKQSVDAQISQESGTKVLKVTAVRKRPRRGNGDSSGGNDGSIATGVADFTEEKFELSFQIGERVDVSGIRGTHEDGVLTLVLPRVEAEPSAQPIEIPIDPPEGDGVHATSAKGADAHINF